MGLAVAKMRQWMRKNPQPFIHSFKTGHFLNTLNENELRDLLIFAQSRHVLTMLPALKDKTMVFVSGNPQTYFLDLLIQEKLKKLIVLTTQTLPNKRQNTLGYATCHAAHPPLRRESVDLVFIENIQNDVGSVENIGKYAPCLKQGGQLLVSTRHPTLELMLTNQNPVSSSHVHTSLKNIWQHLIRSHLFVQELDEALVARDYRAFFMKKGQEYLEEFLGVPLVLLIKTFKFNQEFSV